MKMLMMLAITTMLVAGCSKQKADDGLPVANATVEYMGNPAVDGLGWTLLINGVTEIPTNLAEEFKQQSLPVNVVYKRSDQTYPCRCATPKIMIDIISISRAKNRP